MNRNHPNLMSPIICHLRLLPRTLASMSPPDSINRRRFLILTAATAALPTLRSLAQTPTPTATLKLHSDETGPRIPDNFIGLSYETNELTDPSFFSIENTALIKQFRTLSTNGVLRIGGNTSDIGYWKPTPPPPRPPST